MAGLIGLTASDIEIQDALRVGRWAYEGEWIPHPVVRLTTTLPVAVNDPEGRKVVRARWGFDVGAGRPIGNARDDRLLESPMWRGMLAKTPCLFVTTGIYEQVREPTKQSYWFRRIDGRPIVMPGLSGERGAAADKKLCAAIVTTKPNAFFGQFHDRQVCTLGPDEMDAWMEAPTTEAAMKLLHAPKDEEWEAVPIDDKLFGHGRRELEHLVETGPPVRWTGAAQPPRPSGPRNAKLF